MKDALNDCNALLHKVYICRLCACLRDVINVREDVSYNPKTKRLDC